MASYRKIFLIVDPSRGHTPALHRAARLARATGATLHLGLFEPSPAIAVLSLVSERAMARARSAYLVDRERWLDGLAHKLGEDGVDARSEVDLRTPAHEAIAARVLELKADLVVKDVHRERQLARVVFTPLDWQLLRTCPAPLWLVARAHAGPRPRRMVAAVDTLEHGEGLSDRVFAGALQLAREFETELRLVHVFAGLPAGVVGLENPGQVVRAHDELARLDRERFDAFLKRHGVAADRAHRLEGHPASAIAEFARDARADIVAVGTGNRTGLSRLVMGSTAERLLERLQCDVLAVKPEGFAADLAAHLGLSPQARAAA